MWGEIYLSDLHGRNAEPALNTTYLGSKKNRESNRSYALLSATMARDYIIASKLRAAGVIILGTTSMSEWANFRLLNSSNGWSAQ